MERHSGYVNRGMTFEELVKLPPAELEALRQREVEAFINQAPERVRRRLRGLQFEIDAKRKLHKSALGSCVAISRMMEASLERLHAALQGHPLPEPRQAAEIISFKAFRQKRRDQRA